MGEFGHSYFGGPGFRVDSWGAGPFGLVVDDKPHRFEDSDRFGPSRVNKDGSMPAHPYWPERHRFWIAHRAWRKDGRRLEADGITCIWDEPKPTVARRLGRKQLLVITFGDDDGALVDESGVPL